MNGVAIRVVEIRGFVFSDSTIEANGRMEAGVEMDIMERGAYCV